MSRKTTWLAIGRDSERRFPFPLAMALSFQTAEQGPGDVLTGPRMGDVFVVNVHVFMPRATRKSSEMDRGMDIHQAEVLQQSRS